MRLLRPHIIPIVMALLVLAGCDDQLLPAADSNDDWMPLVRFNYWTYRGTAYPPGATETVATTIFRLDRDTVVAGMRWYGPANSGLQYARRSDGLYLVDRSPNGLPRPHRQIRLPVRVGDTIDAYTIGGGGHRTDVVRVTDAIDVPVTVSLGSFRCLRVAAWKTIRANRWPELALNSVTYEYYALHIGRVRSETWSWSGEDPRHLDSLTELTNVHLRIED